MSMTSGPTVPWRTGKLWFEPPVPSVAVSSAILVFPVQPVRDPGEAFVPPEQHQHVEYAGRGRPAGERGPERLRHLAELDARRLGDRAHRRLCGRGGPFVKRRQCAMDAGEQGRRLAAEDPDRK